ncbi:MAG: DUF2029 domain-containing protein [Myxococcaceae bacterium]|nr:DUF2029 domain-containing protein [Myxococcaceae bacterium]MCI0673048.1 DUF2029 domain-containing protein [Myxococcaceae bacterium]
MGLAAVHAWRIKSGIDFHVLYLAAERALARQPLYQLSESSPFKYSPVAALVLTPLTLLPARAAYLVWNLGNTAALVVWFRWASTLSGAPVPRVRHLLVAGLCLPFLLQVFFLGQCDPLLLAAIAVSERLAERRPLVSGALWGLACLFKFPLLILLPVVLLFGQYRRLLGMVLAAAAAFAAGALWFGWQEHLQQLHSWGSLLAASTPVALCAKDNQSIFAMVCSYVGPMELSRLSLVAASVSAVITCVFCALLMRHGHDRTRSRGLSVAAAVYLSALVSALGWLSNLVALAPLVYVVLGWAAQRERHGRALVARVLVGALGAVVLLNHDTLGPAGFQRMLELRLPGLVALATALLAVAFGLPGVQSSEAPAASLRVASGTAPPRA